MPVDHYENFPVASVLLPARLRAPIEAVYAFARGADDIADEGDAPDAQRLAGLAAYARALDRIEAGAVPDEEPFHRLAGVIAAHHLPIGLLRDLLSAFSQDVVCKRYPDFAELMAYCRRSANPIGRLVLHLFGRTDAQSLAHSDAICSSLQLINFWQDVALDWDKGRVYIPGEDLARFALDESWIAGRRADERWGALMQFQCARARAMIRAGSPLGHALPGRLGLEIRAVVAGGERIVDKIEAAHGDVFRRRPVLGAWDWACMLTRAALRT